ncbi:MAG: hypothetical protein HQM03_10240 [Magnetococcales bacterium]|nr:hypothetical protein [Magnetococcales bacterium]
MKKQFVALLLWVALLGLTGSPATASTNEQTPFTKTEMEKFITDYPNFIQWLSKRNSRFESLHSPWLMAGMRYDKEFTARLAENKWDPDRFFYLLNHINTGLLLTASEKMEAEAKARMEQDRKEMQTQSDQQQQEMRQRTKDDNQEMQKQMAAHQAQIRANPYIPPQEKQRILAQMNQANLPASGAETAGQITEEQNRWFAAQEREIRANPFMHPMQRQQALQQIRQARQFQQQHTAAGQPDGPRFRSQEDMQKEMRNQHQEWFRNQKQSLQANQFIPPAQKQEMLKQLAASETQFNASLEPQPIPSIIPSAEKTLIEANQQKLMGIIFGEAKP